MVRLNSFAPSYSLSEWSWQVTGRGGCPAAAGGPPRAGRFRLQVFLTPPAGAGGPPVRVYQTTLTTPPRIDGTATGGPPLAALRLGCGPRRVWGELCVAVEVAAAGGGSGGGGARRRTCTRTATSTLPPLPLPIVDVVPPLPVRVLRLAPGDTAHLGWAVKARRDDQGVGGGPALVVRAAFRRRGGGAVTAVGPWVAGPAASVTLPAVSAADDGGVGYLQFRRAACIGWGGAGGAPAPVGNTTDYDATVVRVSAEVPPLLVQDAVPPLINGIAYPRTVWGRPVTVVANVTAAGGGRRGRPGFGGGTTRATDTTYQWLLADQTGGGPFRRVLPKALAGRTGSTLPLPAAACYNDRTTCFRGGCAGLLRYQVEACNTGGCARSEVVVPDVAPPPNATLAEALVRSWECSW